MNDHAIDAIALHMHDELADLPPDARVAAMRLEAILVWCIAFERHSLARDARNALAGLAPQLSPFALGDATVRLRSFEIAHGDAL